MLRKIGKGLLKTFTFRVKISILEFVNKRLDSVYGEGDRDVVNGLYNLVSVFLECCEKGEVGVVREILAKMRGREEYWGLVDGLGRGVRGRIEKLLGG